MALLCHFKFRRGDEAHLKTITLVFGNFGYKLKITKVVFSLHFSINLTEKDYE
jgi:hypothetical protein